ncbi:ATP binding L-PSP endoribonuclease family protein-like protein [Phaeosphaeria sp. MPI-PUGE-AT-0046c]|nr:ATP binding L-PSP endoribonuclease family protein-like protein [Phaeosphaeria sp. MPI-PUGE-AT-0046c]
MASSLNVIALISGGKDSLFSILHCQANGHTIVALANLHPAQSANNNDDIDSYMYQTVGHAIIPLYEQALELPLYRQEITGQAINSSRDYEQSAEQEQDETEDLVPLLQKITKAHPETNAVSTGAILSTYQRTRVESVALRLGLTPLSYLWQYPLLPPYTQSSLLHDMAAVGQNAVIIKTATGGLDDSFLGLNVADRRTIARLSKAMARFGEAGNGAIVGEGGEFETLALDGPRGLWKRRIKLGEHKAEVIDGGQTIMKIKEGTVEEKTEGYDEGVLRIPELFDGDFSKVLQDAEKSDIKHVDPSVKSTPSTTIPPTSAELDSTQKQSIQTLSTQVSDTPTVFSYPNITGIAHPPPRSTPSHQLNVIFQRLDQYLQFFQLSKSNINHCTLLLRNMSDFTILNPLYAEYFSAVNPPARVTIAVGDALPLALNTTPLPPLTDVMLSVVLDKTDEDKPMARQGLHVQGRSYWAPANIGPYSQAISVPLPSRRKGADDQERDEAGEIVYIAGQIPLVPATMEIFSPRDFRGQALLSLQHLWRIGRAKGVRWWTAGVGFIPASVSDAEGAGAVARDAWTRLHTLHQREHGDGDEDEDEDEDIDPWDRINNKTTGPVFNDTTYRAPIPEPSALKTATGQAPIPPCFIVQVESLPRNADVEWSAMGLTASSIRFETTAEGSAISTPEHSRSRFFAFEIKDKKDSERISGRTWANGTLYIGRGFEWDSKRTINGVQWIPCHRVWGNSGEEVTGVFVGRVDE